MYPPGESQPLRRIGRHAAIGPPELHARIKANERHPVVIYFIAAVLCTVAAAAAPLFVTARVAGPDSDQGGSIYPGL